MSCVVKASALCSNVPSIKDDMFLSMPDGCHNIILPTASLFHFLLLGLTINNLCFHGSYWLFDDWQLLKLLRLI